MFYHLGHFSKFLDVDWVYLAGSDADSDFKYVVFESPEQDRERTLVMLNRGQTDLVVAIKDDILGTLKISIKARSIESIRYKLESSTNARSVCISTSFMFMWL